MIKLVIADDEKTIRETIFSIIDWESLGIEVIGLCQNGVEAYNMIVDYSPDIVLTDLKMPGMTGLELIENIYESDRNTQFIILSGYGEFEYAKKAMSYGVREYLLKPCNEEQIISSLKSCIERRNKGMALPNHAPTDLQSNISNNILLNALNDAISLKRPIEELMEVYDSYIDFSYTPYRLIYIYYLTENDRDAFLSDLKEYVAVHFPSLVVNGVYVKNTLLLLFKDYDIDLSSMLKMIEGYHADSLPVLLETKEVLYQDLASLMEPLAGRLRRYDDIYFISDFRATYICNYQTHIENVDTLLDELKEGNTTLLPETLSRITNPSFLKQLCSSLILKLSLGSSEITASYITGAIKDLSELRDTAQIQSFTEEKIEEILKEISRSHSESQMTKQIKSYVNENLSNSNITLKYISENILYMNVDYVSKKFLKETGVKFSAFLADLRINKAKELIISQKYDRMQDVAEAVGLGNNPQYFSQLFKKVTGKTPSAFCSDRT